MSLFSNRIKFILLCQVIVLSLFVHFLYKNYYSTKVIEGQKAESSSLEYQEVQKSSYSQVQKIFNSRCIACHSCNESPCQLNLQSYEGLQRGVLSIDIFDRNRLNEIQPTRLYEDADSFETWKSYGFKDIIGDDKSSILVNSVKLGAKADRTLLPNHYPDERQCIDHSLENLKTRMMDPRLAMPYNLPELNQHEIKLISKWVIDGAHPPSEIDPLSKNDTMSIQESIIKEWNDFLNSKPKGNTYKYRLTSRYLYEHLYLAHLYIKNQSGRPQFFRIIRSKTNCDIPQMISTRLPGMDPGVQEFYYCIVKYPGEIVVKNHLPYEISSEKLNWIKKIFIDTQWENNPSKWSEFPDNKKFPPYQLSMEQSKPNTGINLAQYFKDQIKVNNIATATKMTWSSYQNSKATEKQISADVIEQNRIASNPFLIYRDIPQDSRYQFLLEDAYYHIMTFMKGTSCNGTAAVNAVQDHFFVFFLSPEANSNLINWDVLENYEFPGRYGKETGVNIARSYIKQAENRNKARKALNSNLKKNYKNGLPLEAIWSAKQGEQDLFLTTNNHNTALTIFRHNESASIVKGIVGDLPKTVFIMDYSTFERMAYNLVINFDVFGNLGHMILTRSNMGLIRTDAENMYLSFLPPEQRPLLKSQWYNDNYSSKNTGGFIEDQLNQFIIAALNGMRLTENQHRLLYKETEITDIQQKEIKFKDMYTSPEEAHLDLIKKILYEHMEPSIVKSDPINWHKLQQGERSTQEEWHNLQQGERSTQEEILSELTKSPKKNHFASYFPELSILVLGDKERKTFEDLYSVMLNRQFNSISLMIGEETRRLPENETLTITPRVVGYFPNQFFYVNKSDTALREFVALALKINSPDDYRKFYDLYAIKRVDPMIWNIYDFIINKYHADEPIDAGYLDLSRYYYSSVNQ